MRTAMVVWTDPVATDNSAVAPTVTCHAENGSKFDIGETEVICQAFDQAGNLASCSFIIDVIGKCIISITKFCSMNFCIFYYF